MRPKLAEERKFRVGSSEIIHQLIELKIKAGELEMYRSLHAIDAAINGGRMGDRCKTAQLGRRHQTSAYSRKEEQPCVRPSQSSQRRSRFSSEELHCRRQHRP